MESGLASPLGVEGSWMGARPDQTDTWRLSVWERSPLTSVAPGLHPELGMNPRGAGL